MTTFMRQLRAFADSFSLTILVSPALRIYEDFIEGATVGHQQLDAFRTQRPGRNESRSSLQYHTKTSIRTLFHVHGGHDVVALAATI